MKLKNLNILVISPESWGKVQVSKHHYAKALASLNNSVFFLNPPGLLNEFSFVEVAKDLYVVDYIPRFKGLRFLPSKISGFFIRKEIENIESQIRVRIDVIWNFDSSRFFNLSFVSESILKICHIVDLNQNMQRATLSKTSNLCIGTSSYIVEELKKDNPNSIKIGHAYQREQAISSDDVSFKMPGKNRFKALYLGNLSMPYIDWEILYQAGSENQDVDFVFVGPDGDSNLGINVNSTISKSELRQLPNCYFVPAIHADLIPWVLRRANLLLIAYLEEFHKDQAAPHKIMEYLASGIPILSTYTEEYVDQRYDENIFMTKYNRDFPKRLRAIKNQTLSLKPYPVETYYDRIHEIESYL